MVGELITLPVRIGVRATRLWLRAAEESVAVATSAVGLLIRRASRSSYGEASRGAGTGAYDAPSNGRSTPEHDRQPRGDFDTAPEISTETPPAAAATTPPAAPPSGLDAPVESEPVHVSEEPELVEEFAEPGAQDGAGAEIHVEKPWDEYGDMNAKQIVARLGSASAAELAAVQLYESSHRRRQTILNAVQRELRSANGRSSGSQQRG